MTGDFGEVAEGIGSAVTGAAAARAVEPAAGEGKPGAGRHTCHNCGTELVGPHCHNCGQSAHLHQSLAAIGHDLVHGVLHLDGKFWRTLPMLAFRPGQLSRRYIDGQRARFVSPMAIFLFSVFLMFAVFQLVGITAPTEINNSNDIAKPLSTLQQQVVTERDAARAKLDAMKPSDPGYTKAKEDLGQLDQAVSTFGKVKVPVAGKSATFSIDNPGFAWLEKVVDKWRSNPSLMLYKLQSNGYKFSWLLIVLSTPFVWLLFAWKRRFHAYDHAVFVTYSLAFMSLLFIALSLLSAAGLGSGWVFLALAVIPPIHIYKQLRGTYELTRFSAAWRLVVLSAFIVVVLLLFLQVLILIGAF
ncbi:DUF3667 domain-containing protein [Tsuneonella mangrovi]|uniref:DUF3667 domain-containing protein n=1 Tax=Tsuneonella mangrovi TaxID=1982042 RepID=UPI000BA1D02F|nr:DUF3667 domain-containing protein [Tsuneonella mangrovi]